MENFVVFDTETTSLEKPFCYNIGYIITNGLEIFVKKDFVVEQIWHNLPLFNTAYYADKRPLYVKSMKSRKTIMNKFGYICREMARDFEKYEVKTAFAYNSPFDEKVFNFNCDWFKCINPFDNIVIKDIRAYAHKYIISDDYMQFCELNELFTESGNYASTAESVYRYISGNTEFNEEHTALADSEIELEILVKCFEHGARLDEELTAKKSIKRKVIKTLFVKTPNDKTFAFPYYDIRINKERTKIILK